MKKIQVVSTAFLILLVFFAADLSAQTSLYPQYYSATQPLDSNAPLDLQTLISVWTHCDAEMTDQGTVYRSYTNGFPASQPSSTAGSDCKHFELTPSVGLTGNYYEFVNGQAQQKGTFAVDQDKNVVITLNDGSKKKLLTDKLMSGVLVMRDM